MQPTKSVCSNWTKKIYKFGSINKDAVEWYYKGDNDDLQVSVCKYIILKNDKAYVYHTKSQTRQLIQLVRKICFEYWSFSMELLP